MSTGTAVCGSIDPLAAVRAPGDPEYDVYLTGTVFMDIVFTGLDGAPLRGSENWARGMGSSPGGIANMATALARLGLRTTLAATFGTDLYGDYCWESLGEHEGVDLGHSQRLPGWHSPVTVSMAYEGERTMVTHEHPAPLPPDTPVPPARACVASLEPGREECWPARAHRQGSRIFADVGWDDSGRWDLATLTGLRHAHAFLPNAAEALRYTRTTTPEAAVRALAEHVPIAVVTKGPQGAVAVDSVTAETADVPGLRVEALDPTGAGDVFVAGFMTGTLAGWPLADRLAFANLTAALSVQHFGGSLSAPGWAEVAAWWHEASARARAGDAEAAEVARRYGFLDGLVRIGAPMGLRKSLLPGALAAALALLAAACVPGTDGSGAAGGAGPAATGVPDPKDAGNVTLRVWDQETRGGTNGEIEQLNREFQEKYPNVTIKRVSRSFNDLKTTLKLAISGSNPPDVVQANQGYPDMVAFVQAGLLTPLDTYAGIYEWNTRYPATLLNLNRVSADGRQFGTGRLYGVSQTGEFVGVYYNKEVLADAGVEPPETWREFTDSLRKLKDAGELPIQFGNLDKFPAIHTYGVLQDRLGAAETRDTVLGRGDGFDNDHTKDAAATLQDWIDRGYLPEDANGTGYDDANKKFASGDGAYLITGTWMTADLKEPMGDKLGIMPPPPATAGAGPVTTGGQGLSWSITSRSKHPQVAAAYLDHITSPHAADVMTKHGVLPAVPGRAADRLDPETVDGQMVAGWRRLNADDGLVPYLDYATPTFYDTTSAALQELIAGDTGPEEFAEALQDDYGPFIAEQRDAGDGTGS